jgi:hypothetical protein
MFLFSLISKKFKEDAIKSQMEVIPVQEQPTTAAAAISSSGGVVEMSQEQIKEQMIARFYRETNLTLTWSKE